MDQLTIFDELSRQREEDDQAAAEARGALAAYRHRHRTGQLVPGEQCPACGHVLPGRYDGSHDHGLVTDDVCVGMDLTRRHLAHALRSGTEITDQALRAVRAGWPQSTVDAWLASPAALTKGAA